MRIFDTDVQKLKYDILREVARYAYEDRLLDGLTEIPKIIAPGPKPAAFSPSRQPLPEKIVPHSSGKSTMSPVSQCSRSRLRAEPQCIAPHSTPKGLNW